MTRKTLLHSFVAHSHPEIIKMLSTMGAVGYGLFWCLAELIAQQGGQIKLSYNEIAFSLRTNPGIVRQLVEGFDLFTVSEDGTITLSTTIEDAVCLNE